MTTRCLKLALVTTELAVGIVQVAGVAVARPVGNLHAVGGLEALPASVAVALPLAVVADVVEVDAVDVVVLNHLQHRHSFEFEVLRV